MTSKTFNQIFWESITDYHKTDDINTPSPNSYQSGSLEFLLYKKNWIDTVQWHLEDIIRDENIDPVRALEIKREIDASNQRRTDLVEQIDDYFFDLCKEVTPIEGARINTETPAWAIDRLSILNLKIYHMKEEAERTDASEEHRAKCQNKLNVLLLQQKDLSQAIDEMLQDMQSGKCLAKTYKQMKMYNDPSLNPVLRKGGK